MKFEWQKTIYDAGFRATVGNVTLCAVPEREKHGKPARGTKWRACVSHWDASSRTLTRHGRDVYGTLCANAKEAMRLAEQVYTEAL